MPTGAADNIARIHMMEKFKDSPEYAGPMTMDDYLKEQAAFENTTVEDYVKAEQDRGQDPFAVQEEARGGLSPRESLRNAQTRRRLLSESKDPAAAQVEAAPDLSDLGRFDLQDADDLKDEVGEMNSYEPGSDEFAVMERYFADQVRQGLPLTRVQKAFEDGRTEEGYMDLYQHHIHKNAADPKQPTFDEASRAAQYARDMSAIGGVLGSWTGALAMPSHLLATESATQGWQSPTGDTYLRMGGRTWRMTDQGPKSVPASEVPDDARWKGAYAKIGNNHYGIDMKMAPVNPETEIVLSERNPEAEPGILDAFKPKVTIVGVGPGRDGQPAVLTRQQGVGSWLLDMDALPETIALATWDALSRGVLFGDEGISATRKKYVQERRDLMTEAMQIGEEIEEAYPDVVPGEGGKAAGAAVGLLASFGAPNVLGALGDVGRGVSKLSKAARVKQAARVAEELEDYARLIRDEKFGEAEALDIKWRSANPDSDGLARELERVSLEVAGDSPITDIRSVELERAVERYLPDTPGKRAYQHPRMRETRGTPDTAQAASKEATRDFGRNIQLAQRVADDFRSIDPAKAALRSPDVKKALTRAAEFLVGPRGKMDKAKYAAVVERQAIDLAQDVLAGKSLTSDKYKALVRARYPDNPKARSKAYKEILGRTGAIYKAEVDALKMKLPEYADRFEAAARESQQVMGEAASRLAAHVRENGLVSMTGMRSSVDNVPKTAAEWYASRAPNKLDELKALARGSRQSVVIGGQVVTRDNLATVQAKLDSARQSLKQERNIPLRLTRADAVSVDELSLSEGLESFLSGFGRGEDASAARQVVGNVLRGLGGILMGSDAYHLLRAMPAASRKVVISGLRELSLVSGDLGILMRHNPDDLIAYLKGKRANHASGRRLATSGYNVEDAIRGYYGRLLNSLDPKQRARARKVTEARRQFGDNFNFTDYFESLPAAEQQKMLEDAAVMLKGKGGFDLATQIGKEIGLPDNLNPQDFHLLVKIMDFIEGTSDVEDLLKFVQTTYAGPGVARARRGAHLRVGHVIAIYGHRARVMSEWADDWVVVLESDLKNATAVLVADPRVTKEQYARGVEVIKRWGVKFNEGRLDAAESLYAASQAAYLPAPVRKMLEEQVSSSLGAARKITSAADPKSATGFAIAAYIKSLTTRGYMFAKPSYYLMNLADTFAFTYTHYGLRTATMQLLGHAPQNILAAPFVANVLGATGSQEAVRRVLGELGADVASALARGDAGMHPNVNAIFDAEGLVQVGDQVYKAADIRRTFVRAGVMTGFEIEGIGGAVREGQAAIGGAKTATSRAGQALQGARQKYLELGPDAMADLSEAWAERERVGLAVLLMREHGMTPIEAAERANKVLLEFKRGESYIEKSWVFQMAQPFWTFVRANQRAFIDVLNDPDALIRAGHILKVFDRGPEAITEILREIQAEDPYGMDYDYLPPEYRDAYRTMIALKYLQKLTPEQEEDFERALEMAMAATNVRNQDRRRYELINPTSRNPSALSTLMLAEPMIEALPSYSSEGAVEIALPRTDRVRAAEQYSAKGKTSGGYEEMNSGARLYAYVSEPAIVAALEHSARLAAASVALSGVAFERYKYDGTGEVSADALTQQIAEFLDPENNPVGRTTIDMLDPENAKPYQIHPTLYKFFGPSPEIQTGFTVKTVELRDANGDIVQYPAVYAEGAAAAVIRSTPIFNELNRYFMGMDNLDYKRTGWGNVDIPVSVEHQWVGEDGKPVVGDKNMEINIASLSLEMVGIRTTSR